MSNWRIYLIHRSTMHQRNVIRALHFLMSSLRDMDPLRGTNDPADLQSCTVGTCEFFLAAVAYTLLQILQLVFHLLILPLCLLTLSPERTNRWTNTTRVSLKQKSCLKWGISNLSLGRRTLTGGRQRHTFHKNYDYRSCYSCTLGVLFLM